jgi:hypothetical protein
MPAASPYDQRLLAKIDQRGEDECWPWLAAKHASGHGVFRDPNRKAEHAHVSVYRYFVGEVPEGMELDHACHTRDVSCEGGPMCPHRACVNPAHQEPVTKKENLRRGQSPPAINARKTHCIHDHELSPDNLMPSRLPDRQCKVCHYEREKRYAANRRARRRAESP